MRNLLARKMSICLLALSGIVSPGCSDDYDDSKAWKDIDAMQKELASLAETLAGLQNQATAVHSLIGGGSITMIADSPDGGKVVSYKGSDNVEHSFTIALKSQMTDDDILGIKADDDGIYYWTVTRGGKTDWLLDQYNSKIPVTGSAPRLEVNSDGNWTINGQVVRDASGNPVKAGATGTPLVSDVKLNGDGTATLTLGTGEQVSVKAFTLFNMQFKRNGSAINLPVTIDEGASTLSLTYDIVGDKAAEALVIMTRVDDGMTAQLNTTARTLDFTFAEGFDSGVAMLMLYDTENNVLIKPVRITLPVITNAGIGNADTFIKFISAVTSGGSIRQFADANGDVVLLNDIDMTGYKLTAGAGAAVKSNTTTANKAVTYTLDLNTFNSVFDGQGHTIKNLDITYDQGDGSVAHGLFTALGAEGVIKNLTVQGTVKITGDAPQGSAIGGIVGVNSGKMVNCVSRLDMDFAGTDGANFSVRMGGIAGVSVSGTFGDETAAGGCVNYGNMTCGAIVNSNSGANAGFHQGGIAGYVQNESKLSYCVNNGAISAPSGRGGGIVGTLAAGVVDNCTNNGFVQDDVNGVFATTDKRYNIKRMGGIVGGSATSTVSNCTNNGNVFSQDGCRTGGFVGHNGGTVTGCTNKGIILSDFLQDGNVSHGAGWACGYSSTSTTELCITDCHIGGKVGDYTLYKDAPETAPNAKYSNAVNYGYFDVTSNNISNRDDDYYDWTVEETRNVASGLVYTRYSFTNFAERIHVLEIDLTNPKVTIETSMADDLAPNPNANNRSNNGKNLRETLSENIARKRTEGRNIVAGINTGFFDSHFGIPRGLHIEKGEAVFINNPNVRKALANHVWGFTFYKDRTLAFDKRSVSGNVKVAGQEYPYYSVNDTMVALTQITHDANVYTHRFLKEPHPGIFNKVGTKALFIVAKGSDVITVNTGYQEAVVTNIIDGRNADVEAPFVSEKGEWVLQVTGEKADALAAAVHTGDKIEIELTVGIGEKTAPIDVYNASMYYYMQNGQYAPPTDAGAADKIYQTMNIGANQERTKVYLFAVDGVKTYRGLDFYEAARVAQKLGITDVVRVDGGGSTTMWVYDDNGGSLVNNITDSKGERSCMNYLHVRVTD